METGFYTSDVLSSTLRGSHSTALFYAEIKGTHSIPPPRNGKKKQLCVYCKGDHSSSICDIVKDIQKRLEIGKSRNLCFNCLSNHSAIQSLHVGIVNTNTTLAYGSLLVKILIRETTK